MADFRWTSLGGVLVDGTGDIATTLSAQEELETMVATRLKHRLPGSPDSEAVHRVWPTFVARLSGNKRTTSLFPFCPFAIFLIRSRLSPD